MAKTKLQKKEIIEKLKEKIEKQKIMIFVDFSGLMVDEISQLRKNLKENNSEIKVVKKSLAHLAFKEKNIDLDPQTLPGQLAIVFGWKDFIIPAKIVWQFSKENPNLKILGGFLENSFLEKEKIVNLAKLPTKEEILANLINKISAPISGLLNSLQWNQRKLLFVLSSIKVGE